MKYWQIVAQDEPMAKPVVNEAIPHRPRNLAAYLTHRIQELDKMIDVLAKAKILIKTNEKDGADVFGYALRYGSEDTPDHTESRPPTYLLLDYDLAERYRLADLKYALESYLKYGSDSDFLKYIFSTLEFVRPMDDEYRQVIRLLPYAEAGFPMYGYDVGNPEHEADPEYTAAKNLVTACRMIASVLARIEPLQADVRAKLAVIQRMKNHDATMQGSHKYHPEHGDVETLYHATAYIKEIMRDGFSAENPVERKGVGNLGRQDTISFSHDIEISRNIMRSLKELWMIAHGQLTAPQILAWARAEGIEDKIRQAWKSNTGDPFPGRASNPEEVAKLHRTWQWFSKLRANPVIMSPWEVIRAMENRDISDIGVLACEVKLQQDDEYRFAEAEFRLSADRVISVKQAL